MRNLVFLISVLVFGCNLQKVPKHPNETATIPQAPDYTQRASWAAHPAQLDAADLTPNASIVEAQASARADVFFLHPTTYFGGENWNGDILDTKLNGRTDSTAIMHQASIFNGSCRVFAPRYRQMVYGAFFVDTPDEKRSAHKAAEIAYEDINNAFLHYMKQENNGRPFIIAGHSQGTALGIRLIRAHENDPGFKEKLLAAYLPGWGVKADTFAKVPPCKAADDFNCFLSWCSYEWGATAKDPSWYSKAVAINPVTWTLSDTPASKDLHQGLVLRKYHNMYSQVLETKVNGNILWVTRPDVPGKWVIQGENFHIGDYNLFWLDVRKNVETRVNAYFQANPG